jgi:RHS repeat-associated protein
MLINDQYTLRLTVFDRGGNTQEASANVQVARDMKIGNFSLTFTDLSVPMSGLPIVVNRVYDSRDKRKGDFGIGWRLEVQTMRIRTNRVLGTGWVRGQSGASITLSPTDAHKVSVTLPDGRVEEFDMQVSPTSALGSLDFTNVIGFTPRGGTVGRLEAMGDNSLAIVNAGALDELVEFGSLNTYNPQLYRYTSPDGTEFVVHRTSGVQSIKETNGNTLTFGANGIIHSAGKSALFQRDSEGRIVQLTDPRGGIQTYNYDTNGDLISHADPLVNITRFAYDHRHNLLQITDPLNRNAVRNEYDDKGRLIQVTDASGNRTTFAHDIDGRRETTTDRLGRVSSFVYDDRGNIVSRTNALGETESFTYDSQGNRLTARNALGHTSTFAYDSRNNLTSSTNALGHTTTFTYNIRNQLVSSIDPLGRSVTSSYDASGNLTGLTDSLNRTTAIGYDTLGNRLSTTDPIGNIIRNAYDATGNRTALTPPIGDMISFSYDANGNLRSQVGASGPAYSLAYNGANQPTNVAIGGLTRQLTYDAVGQITKGANPEGKETQLTYDVLGQVTQIAATGNGPAVGRVYDAEGNVLSETDFAGNLTRYVYDAADRLIQTIFPDGTTEQRLYDAASNLIQITDALGRTTRFGYDAAQRQTSITDALGNVIVKQYDAVGNLIALIDPLGHSTQFTYDAGNQLTRTTFADGSTEQRFYDNNGRLIRIDDAKGASVLYAYDALNRLISVRDGLGQLTRYEYNLAGQRVAIVDANGNRTTFVYDDHGRLLRTTFPDGNTESVTYDSVGRVLTTTNGNGDTVQYLYDSRGLPIRRTLPGGTQENFTFSADGLILSASATLGVTQFEYHPTSRRLVRVTEPDGRYVRHEYDAAGNRTLMAHAMNTGAAEEITQYAYDVLNRITQVTHPGGGLTRYAYDAAGNQTSIVRPNGTTTTIGYDTRNRVNSVVHRSSDGATLAGEQYTLDALGNRAVVTRADGSRVEYSYDLTSKVTEERHFNSSNVNTQTVGYLYDAVGNVVGRTGTLGNASFTYNSNNQLVSGDGSTYNYDGAGNLLSQNSASGLTRYTYDALGRLTRHQSSAGGLTTYSYDFRGIRQRKSGPAGTINFLVDRNNATGFDQVVRESDTSGATVRSFVYGAQLLEQNQSGALSYYHADALGSVRLLTNAAGVPSDTYAYLAYGGILGRTGTSLNPYRFAGEQQDDESSLYYLRARYYDAGIGRFLSRDPFAGEESNPLSLHKYLYVHANPVNLTDPSGLWTLIEIQNVIVNQVNQHRERLVQFKRAVEKAKDALAISAKIAGGVIAATAVLESLGNVGRPVKWFGPLFAGKGVWGTLRIASDMIGAKPTRFDLGVASFDCFANRNGAWAHVNHFKNQFRPGIGARANPAVVDLCPPFFVAPPLPVPAQGVFGTPSMMGVMIHEFSHITLGTDDSEYLCAPLLGLSGPRLSGKRLAANADTYRCFARDSWLGGGMEVLQNLLR